MFNSWKNTVMCLIWSTIIFMVAQVFSAMFLAMAVGTSFFSKSVAEVMTILTIMFVMLMAGGFVWYFFSLGRFTEMQRNETDRTTMRNILIANIILVGGFLFTLLISFFVNAIAGWWLNWLIEIGAYVWLMISFGQYAKSTALPEGAKVGANFIRVACIVALSGTAISFIPIVGTALDIMAGLAYIALLFIGWSKIANHEPEVQ